MERIADRALREGEGPVLDAEKGREGQERERKAERTDLMEGLLLRR